MKCYGFFTEHSFQSLAFELLDSTFYRKIELFADAIFRYITTHTPNVSNNHFIYDLAEKFIREYNLDVNDNYRRKLSLIDKPMSYILLYPYQPNIFPSISVVAPFICMDLTVKLIEQKYHVSVIPVYLIVDYDCKSDRRFSTSYIPSITNAMAKFNLSYPTNKNRFDIMMSCEKPDRMLVESWKIGILKELNELRHKDIGISNEVKPNLINILQMIEDAYGVANSFSSFNSSFLYNLINLKWDLGVVFIEGHGLYNNDTIVFKKYQERIEDIIETIVHANNVLNIKYNCVDKFSYTSKDIYWRYSKSCHMRCKIDKECGLKCVPEYIFPTVLTDYLNDYLYLGKVAAVGYYKQTYLTVLSDSIIKKVFDIEPCPQLLTNVGINSNMDSTIIKYLVQNAKNRELYLAKIKDPHCSILFYLLTFGFSKTKEYIINSKII